MNRIFIFVFILLLAVAAPTGVVAQISDRTIVHLPADVEKLRKASPAIEDMMARQKVAVYVQLTSISHVQPDGSLRREPIKFGARQVTFLRNSKSKPMQIVCLQKNVSGCSEPPYFSGGLISSDRFSYAMPRFELNRLSVLSGSAIVIRTDFAALYPVNGQGELQRLPAEQEDRIMLADLLRAADAQENIPKQVPHRIVVRFNGHIFHFNYTLYVTGVPVR